MLRHHLFFPHTFIYIKQNTNVLKQQQKNSVNQSYDNSVSTCTINAHLNQVLNGILIFDFVFEIITKLTHVPINYNLLFYFTITYLKFIIKKNYLDFQTKIFIKSIYHHIG